MPGKSTATTYREFLAHHIRVYRQEHPGPLRMEDVAEWIIRNKDWDPPRPNPKRILTRDLKRSAREHRMSDPQGRTVRVMHAAKIERVDLNGNLVFDVVWDHLYEMSLDHGIMAFMQRHENIGKQCNSLHRDTQSFNDNNPNARGHEIQLSFTFMVEEPVEQIVETIQESSGPEKPR